jgi:energy-coupling factor transporter ATP-binding protein EcfA2
MGDAGAELASTSRRGGGGDDMIEFDDVTITYPDAEAPTLRNVDFVVPPGELCLVVGRTGSGKSTLLRAVNGLVPHFTGGRLSGRVRVAGRDTRTHPPRELADVVAVVGQEPLAGFVTDIVEDELAYGMESLSVTPQVMRRRVEETLDLLGLTQLRSRPLTTLSAGEQQRVAIGAALTTNPQVLVLDEPTSALDPPAAEEVLAALTRLVQDLGLTVLVAEHRLERVVQYADLVVHVPGGGEPLEVGKPAKVLATTPVAPPVVELARWAGWSPVPLSVRDARRHAADLRTRLAVVQPPAEATPSTSPDTIAQTRGLVMTYDDTIALRAVDLSIARGEIVALMGRNGAGKSTLLHALVGLRRPDAGTVVVDGHAPADLPAQRLIRSVALVPQEPGDLLYAENVAAECALADGDTGAPPGTTRALLDELGPGVDDDAHARDLSSGQRLAVALAVTLAAQPPLLLLDEPTRGLDYRAKAELTHILRALAGQGRAIVLATHDVELVADVATRTVVLADGEVVADGPTRDVVTHSPAFAPQVAKVFAPLPWLTVADIRKALAG